MIYVKLSPSIVCLILEGRSEGGNVGFDKYDVNIWWISQGVDKVIVYPCGHIRVGIFK